MELTGKLIFWANKHENKENGKTWTTYATSLSNKTADGDQQYWSVDVRFPGVTSELDPGRYDVNVEKGFLSFREYMTAAGEKTRVPVIVVQEFAGFTSHTEKERVKPAGKSFK